jgi:uncharacterized protein (DUF1778 family)
MLEHLPLRQYRLHAVNWNAGVLAMDTANSKIINFRAPLADQTRFVLNQQALQRFNALLNAPLEHNAALRRILSSSAPWER